MAQIDVFMHAIRIQESGNNYSAHNSSSGASGAYQFTLGTWRYAIGLAGLSRNGYSHGTAAQAPAWMQDAAAKALMSKYYNDFGHSWYNVAEAWYGGPGAVGHPGIGGGPGYPNVGQYASHVISIYNSLGGSGGTSRAPPDQSFNATAGNQTLRQISAASRLLEEDIPTAIAHIQQQAIEPS
ncbi:MAG: transglycosylase family protein [Candidatus Saccharimonadales bacterium]